MSAKILVCIPVLNRKKIVEQCLPTVANGLSDDDTMNVYNDGSTEYGEAWLSKLGNYGKWSIGNKNVNVGIDEQRRRHFGYFADSEEGYTHLYLTDGDAIHDPSWRSISLAIQSEHDQAPLCLYNTSVHANMPNNTIEDNPKSNVIWRKFAPGISYLLTAEHVKKVMEQIHYVRNWDWDVPRILGHRFAVSRVSYVDHIGAGGQHHDGSEGFDGGDRCLNPTPFLVEKRKEIVAALSKEA